MANFETSVALSLEIPRSELRSARSAIEGGLSDVSVSGGGGGAAARATGGSDRQGRRMFRWARQRTSYLETMVGQLDDIEDRIGGGGMGGGGGTSFIGLGGLKGLGGTIAGALGGVTLSNLISKVPFSALVKRVTVGAVFKAAASVATLFTGKAIIDNLITGKLELSDVINPLNNLGSLITGPIPLPDLVETVTGIGVFIAGAVSIGKFLSAIAPAALTSLLPSISIGSILSGLGTAAATLAGLLGSAPIAALIGGTIAGAALLDYFGVIDINDIVEGVLDIEVDFNPFDTVDITKDQAEDAVDTANDRTDLPPRRTGKSYQTGNPFTGLPVGGGGGDTVNVDNSTRIDVQAENTAEQIKEEIRKEQDREREQLERRIQRAMGGRSTR